MACWTPVFILNKTYWIKQKKILLTFPEDQWCIIYTISATTYKQFTKLHGKYDRESDRTSKCNGSQANKPKQDLLHTYELLTKDAWHHFLQNIQKKHCLLTYKTKKYNVCSICIWKLKNKLNPNIVVTLLPEIFQFNPSFSRFISLIISWSSPKS